MTAISTATANSTATVEMASAVEMASMWVFENNDLLNDIIQGGEDTNLDFTMGPNTGIKSSCAATLNGEMLMFGGDTHAIEKQVNKMCFKKGFRRAKAGLEKPQSKPSWLKKSF